MDVTFHAPSIAWRQRKQRGVATSSAIDDLVSLEWFVTATVPIHSNDSSEAPQLQVQRLPSTFTIPYEDEQELLRGQPVEFRLFAGNRRLAPYMVALRNCIPLLTETSIKWVQEATPDVEACIEVHVTTNRQPRQVIARALDYQARTLAIAKQLSLHKYAVAVGLVPPILGGIAGVTLTSPLWIPLTLIVGVLGLPIWVVLTVAALFMIVISAMSALITVRVVQSKRVQTRFREICQSPNAQMLLFNNASSSKLPSPSELRAQATQYIMADPSRKLLASLAIDTIGNATFVVPGLGELADMFWAPASASLVSSFYGDTVPSAKYLAFVEEFLPFTDFIPTATLAWLKENWSSEDIKAHLNKLRIPA